MRAATIRDGEVLVEEHPDPEPGAGQVLVRVRAAGLNGADQMQLPGATRPRPARRRTSPASSWRARSSASARARRASPRATASWASSAAAARASWRSSTSASSCRCPRPSTLRDAGGLPEVFTTAHDAIFTQAGLRPGERLLVHGAAGGVGTAAVQLAHAVGAHVTATVRNPDARDAVAQLGADEVLEPEGFEEHGPFDVVLELVGAPNLGANLKALNTNGRIVVIGIAAGAKAELNLAALMGKRARIMASTLRARPLEQKAATARAMEREVLPRLRTRRAARAGRRDVRARRRRRRLRALRRRRQARQDHPRAVIAPSRSSAHRRSALGSR